jgi:hypothetical protein
LSARRRPSSVRSSGPGSPGVLGSSSAPGRPGPWFESTSTGSPAPGSWPRPTASRRSESPRSSTSSDAMD